MLVIKIYHETQNLASTREAPQVVEYMLAKKVILGRMDGPVESIQFPNLCLSTVGIVPYVRFLYHLTNQGFN